MNCLVEKGRERKEGSYGNGERQKERLGRSHGGITAYWERMALRMALSMMVGWAKMGEMEWL